jgi:hypothetical protein
LAGGLALVAIAGFVLGANVRNGVITQLSPTAEGSQLFGLDQAIPIVARRLDLGVPLEQAIRHQNDPSVESALSWTFQVQAFVPRFLWPDKPIIDYGQQVSVTVYGLQYGQSSSTLSTVGDVLVNLKLGGVVIIAFFLGLALTLAERRIGYGTELASAALAAGLSYAIVGQETSVIVTVAALIRNLIVAAILWRTSQVIRRVLSPTTA